MIESNGVIYRPGVPSAQNHVATWPEIQAKITAAEGAIAIYIDDSIMPTHVPAASGVTNCQGATFIGYQTEGPSSFPNLIIDDGAQLLDVREFASLTVTGNPSGGTPSLAFSFGGAFESSTLIARNANLVGGAGNTAFIVVPDGKEFDLHLFERSDTTGSGSVFLQIGASSFLDIIDIESSVFQDNLVQGPPSSAMFLEFDDTTFTVPETYIGFAGFYVPLPLNETTGYPSTATTNAGFFAFETLSRNENYAVLVFGGGVTTVNMPSQPVLWEQHEIKNFDGVTITVSGNGFMIENPAVPGTYVPSFVTTVIGNLRFRFFPAGFTNQPTGVWTLV
jgi:hypothetical protein